MALILDGTSLQAIKRDSLRAAIAELKQAPRLAIIQVGHDPRSDVYIRYKTRFAEAIGAEIFHIQLPDDTTQATLEGAINECNVDAGIHGIIVQLPLPATLQPFAKQILNHIDEKKDVDGLSAKSKASLMSGTPLFVPATTKGVISMLDHYQIPIEGAHAVVLGRSDLVGKPTALALLNRNATVSVAHSRSTNVEELTSHADIIVSAVGKPGLITPAHVSTKSVIVDVGITVVDEERKKIVGDADFDALKDKVRAISPVPGGVGPLTIACLFENLLDAYRLNTHAQ